MNRVERASYRHIFNGITVSLVNALVMTGIGYFFKLDYLVMPIVVTCLFSVFETVALSLVWRWVALSHADSLPLFYSASSGFRMLFALFILTAVCLVVGRDAMAPYVIVFVVNYIVMLVVHSRFFTKQVGNTLK